MSAVERVALAAKTIRAAWERRVVADPQTTAAQALEDVGLLMSPEKAAEQQALRARVAELEAERHSTNEALDDAVQAPRANQTAEPEAVDYPPALPWARLMDAGDLADFLDELAASVIIHASSEVALAEVEKTCATWRLVAEAQYGHNAAPVPDGITRAIAPTQALQPGLPGSPATRAGRAVTPDV